MATGLLIISTIAMMYVITHYKRGYPTYFDNEIPKPITTTEEVLNFKTFEKYEIEFRRSYKTSTYCKYEVVAYNQDDITARLINLCTDLKTDDRDVVISLLNPNNEEQVIKVIENGELIWQTAN